MTAHRVTLFVGLALTLLAIAGCGNERPRDEDIIDALERTDFMNEKITADRISSMHCTPLNDVYECVIVYRTQKRRAPGEVGIDRVSKLRLQLELVGKRWRVSKLVLT